jgi:membrane-bound serine protease (ClpP class)
MNEWVILAIWLAGMALVTAEVFVPGAVLGIMGAVAVVTGVVLSYSFGHRGMGHTLLAISVLSVPLFFWLWKTVVVRWMSLQDSEAAYKSYSEDLDGLVGAEGVATTVLRPSGTARIEGRRVDVVARGEMIESGAAVKVVEVTGNRVVVKRV